MNKRLLLWGIPALFYVIFSFWYTNIGGPLTEDEISYYLEQLEASGGDEEQLTRMKEFMESDNGNQFLMLNNIDMAENPPDVEGAEPGESAQQLLGRYMEYMYPALFKRACHPVYAGRAVFRSMDIVGIENAEEWDQAALMRYRSRRDLLEIAGNPVFQGRHEFKVAALTKTIAYPLENILYFSDPRFLLAIILLAVTALLDLFVLRSR